MLDRLKGARAADTEPTDQKPVETRFGDGMPRFQPQPGGFGRRATPVGAATPQPREAGAAAGCAQPQFQKPDAAAVGASPSGEPALGDIPTRISDWLMRE